MISDALSELVTELDRYFDPDEYPGWNAPEDEAIGRRVRRLRDEADDVRRELDDVSDVIAELDRRRARGELLIALGGASHNG